jgi:His-Xaa-Ser system radical SAM maturase HxsC
VPADKDRGDFVLLWRESTPPSDTAGYAAILTPRRAPGWKTVSPLVHSTIEFEYLSDGDVVSVQPSGFVRALYRKGSPHNFILVTDQCNSFCLMCSQPPRQVDDFDRIREHLRLIDLIDPEARELGITGGEPTLFKDDFLRLVGHCKERLPNTALHVLTNGRMFYYREFARRLGAVGHPDIMLGVPVYSDVDSEHDYVVQARGAFEETVLGLHNLSRYGVPVEIRVVVHRQTYKRLPRLAEFIARNFPFAAHVALMGMEMYGFVNRNLGELWVDPHEYQPELYEATEALFTAGMRVSIYNHQLCVLDRRLWQFARKSISDWKNIYLEECTSCVLREECGGLFQSAAKRHSAYIMPFRETDISTECQCRP